MAGGQKEGQEPPYGIEALALLNCVVAKPYDESRCIALLSILQSCVERKGGAKIQEEFYIFQELCEKYVWSVPLMNGSAVCQMHMGHFDEAETLLLDALSKDSKDPGMLATLIVASLHLGKPTARYLSQLKVAHPDHPLVERATSGEVAFEQAIQPFERS
ncbi:unnamed protein product [Calypogeia fissa]